MDPQGDSGTGLRPESFRIREAVHHVGYGSGHLRDQMGGRQRLDSCHAYDYTEEGIRNFYDFITDEHLYKSFLQGRYQMMVALDGERVIGAASVRNYNHLSLLFVDEEYHHRGIGRDLMRRMCEYLKKEEGERYMSLKAAPYAVEFYRKLGFHAVHEEEAFSGIRVTPMEKFL